MNVNRLKEIKFIMKMLSITTTRKSRVYFVTSKNKTLPLSVFSCKILIEFNIGVFISLIRYATENKIDDIKIEYDKLLSLILYLFFIPLSISLYVKYNSETPKNIVNKSSDTA